MKQASKLRLLVLTTSVLFASELDGQTKVGIGVSLNPTAVFNEAASSYIPVGLTNIYVPIMPTPNFRIEPEVGIFHLSSESSSYKSSSTNLRLAIGIFYVHPLDSCFNSYYGPRVGILPNSHTETQTGIPDFSTSRTDFFIGLCVGGEYVFSHHCSVGGEAQMNYISFGDSNRTRRIYTNNALVFFRWYF